MRVCRRVMRVWRCVMRVCGYVICVCERVMCVWRCVMRVCRRVMRVWRCVMRVCGCVMRVCGPVISEHGCVITKRWVGHQVPVTVLLLEEGRWGRGEVVFTDRGLAESESSAAHSPAPSVVRSAVGGRGEAVDLHPPLRVRGGAHAVRQPGGGLLQLRWAGRQWPRLDRQASSPACVLTARLTTRAVPARRSPIGVSSLRTAIHPLGPRSAGAGPGLISSRRAVPRCVPDRRRLPLPHGRGTPLHRLCLQRLCGGRGQA